MSEIQSHETHKNWPRKALLTRTKPVDSFSDLCQQLTHVVAQQTALSDKLIEAFRETRETGQNNLLVPSRDSGRYTPSPEPYNELNRQIIFKVPSTESFEEEDQKIPTQGEKVSGIDCLNAVSVNIDMIRTCNYAAMNQLRSIMTGQVCQENIQNSLSQVYSTMTLINTQCDNSKNSLGEVEHAFKERNFTDSTSESKSTQTQVVEIESDPDDKDSGLESNPGRNSETGISLEDFQLYTDYDELMQASMPEEITQETKRRPSFLKDKKNSCPSHLLQRKIKFPKQKIVGIKETSIDEPAVATSSDTTTQCDDTLTTSPNTSDVFSPVSETMEPVCTQSFPVDFVSEISPKKKTSILRAPKLGKLQRAATICNPSKNVSDDEDSLGLNLTQSSAEIEKDAERDFANLENQVNIIKFNYSTNSFTCKGRKEGLKQLVSATRKQISCEMNDLITKLTPAKRRKSDETTPMDEATKIISARIDDLIQVSQHFGATLHEITHSDEKEILINFIETIKIINRPSMPNSGSISCFTTFQRTDSALSSGENERRSASPTPSPRYSLKAMETTYEKGLNEGVDLMKNMLQKEMEKSEENLSKFYRYSDAIESVLNSEKRRKDVLLFSYGAYILFVLIISVIVMLFV